MDAMQLSRADNQFYGTIVGLVVLERAESLYWTPSCWSTTGRPPQVWFQPESHQFQGQHEETVHGQQLARDDPDVGVGLNGPVRRWRISSSCRQYVVCCICDHAVHLRIFCEQSII